MKQTRTSFQVVQSSFDASNGGANETEHSPSCVVHQIRTCELRLSHVSPAGDNISTASLNQGRPWGEWRFGPGEPRRPTARPHDFHLFPRGKSFFPLEDNVRWSETVHWSIPPLIPQREDRQFLSNCTKLLPDYHDRVSPRIESERSKSRVNYFYQTLKEWTLLRPRGTHCECFFSK